jgi:hypothetical protein
LLAILHTHTSTPIIISAYKKLRGQAALFAGQIIFNEKLFLYYSQLVIKAKIKLQGAVDAGLNKFKYMCVHTSTVYIIYLCRALCILY